MDSTYVKQDSYSSDKRQDPEECWSGIKPTVDYFRVWGCIGDVHVPDTKRSKLDDKSYKCVFLGYRDESKAYKLFNHITKKIVISRYVMFDKGENWNWGRSEEEVKLDVLDWGDDYYEDDEHDLNDSDKDEESAEGNQDESSAQTDSYGGSGEVHLHLDQELEDHLVGCKITKAERVY